MRAFGRTLRRRPLRKLLTLLQLLLGSLATTLALSPYLTPTDTARQNQFYLTAGFQDENGENLVYGIFSEYGLESIKALAPRRPKPRCLHHGRWRRRTRPGR